MRGQIAKIYRKWKYTKWKWRNSYSSQNESESECKQSESTELEGLLNFTELKILYSISNMPRTHILSTKVVAKGSIDNSKFSLNEIFAYFIDINLWEFFENHNSTIRLNPLSRFNYNKYMLEELSEHLLDTVHYTYMKTI